MNGRRASVRRERRVVVRQESSRLDGTERRLGRPDRVIARRSGHRGLFPGGYACAGSAGTARPAARQHACAHASTSAGNAPFVAGAAARPCAGDAVLAELTSRKPAWILIDLRPVTRGEAGSSPDRPGSTWRFIQQKSHLRRAFYCQKFLSMRCGIKECAALRPAPEVRSEKTDARYRSALSRAALPTSRAIAPRHIRSPRS